MSYIWNVCSGGSVGGQPLHRYSHDESLILKYRHPAWCLWVLARALINSISTSFLPCISISSLVGSLGEPNQNKTKNTLTHSSNHYQGLCSSTCWFKLDEVAPLVTDHPNASSTHYKIQAYANTPLDVNIKSWTFLMFLCRMEQMAFT